AEQGGKHGAAASLALAQGVQLRTGPQVHQHHQRHQAELGEQPGTRLYPRDQAHAQGDRQHPGRRGDAEEQAIGGRIEEVRTRVALAAAARREQPQQQEQPGEPDRHRGDVRDLQREQHAAAPTWPGNGAGQGTGCVERAAGVAAEVPAPRFARARRTAILLLAGIAPTAPALAHDSGHGVPTLADAWTLSPLLLVPLALFVALYLAGLRRLWRGGHVGRGISRAEGLAFAAGVVALLLATVWPFDALGEWSLAAHMAQHMLLLAVAPPLLLAARPRAALAAALPADWSRAVHRVAQALAVAPLRSLATATMANVAVMWGWHMPAALELALASDAVHWLMHASFLAAGLWLWSLLWQRQRDDAAGGALAGTVAIVVVMMQMGLLGALLTFSRRSLFPFYAARAPQLGLDVLADQQLAGLIMWVPSSLPYLVGAIWLLAREFGRVRQAR